MFFKCLWLLTLAEFISPVTAWTPPTYNDTVIAAFASKTWLNPIPINNDPYDAVPALSAPNFRKLLHDTNEDTTHLVKRSGNELDSGESWGPDAVCAVYYPDNDKRDKYYTFTWPNTSMAILNGSHVTHLHPCGTCSSTKDLSVYMANFDLTGPVRKCALKAFVSKQWSLDCLRDIGFTDYCTRIWYFNAINTRKDCGWTCIRYINAPYNEPDGSLNPCLQCDEDNSGPVFKQYSGRTRRDSGLLSAIHRPPSSIAHITHYYY